MKNKIEFKKVIIWSALAVLALSIAFWGLNYMEYRAYTSAFNEKLNMIVSNIKRNYPDIDLNDIVKSLNESDINEANILREYGIDINKDSAILKNEYSFKKYLSLEISVFIILVISLATIFLIYNYKKDKKLKEITMYIDRINRGDYKLNIENNTEDELSILKNEVYKTTVMLKEVAENSKKDKISLKDSISDISHQLKTPLTSITIMLDNMLDDKDMKEETRHEFIKDIKREITNLSFLVSSLLKLSKFDANTINFVNKEENVEDILKEAEMNLAGLCDLKNVKINISGEAEEKIKCDFKWQVEAITNIVKNCVEHSYEGSEINIRYSQNNIYTKIEIRDEGSGIDEKDLPHIFERFYKGKDSSDSSVGIGLALAKLIIEENNGYVDVESELGNGTVFTIKFFK